MDPDSSSLKAPILQNILIDSNAPMVCASALDLVREGVFCLTNNEIIVCNQALRSLLELEGERIPKTAFVSRLTPALDAEASRGLTALLNGVGSELYMTLRLPSGAEKDLHINTITCSTASGSELYGVIREIVGRQTAVDSKEAFWLLNAIFDGIEEGILFLQPKTMVIERANPAAARMFDASIESLIGRAIIEMIADASRKEELSRTIGVKLPFQRAIHLDLEMRRESGSTFPALHGISEITDEQGDVIAWMWIVTDMTQRVYLNRALTDLETRYRLLFNRAADPMLIIDAQTRKIIDANIAAGEQLGYNRSELIGLAMDDITPESRRGEMSMDFSSIPVGGSLSINGVNLSRNGAEIPVQTSVVATDFEGRKVYIASSRDVSQQRSLEQERLRVEKLDAARKVAGGLAHEFSQPLQGLTTIVDLLNEPSVSDSVRQELIMRIEPSVDRMVALLDQMKRIVRLETKPYTGSDHIVDIHHSVKLDDPK